MTRKQYITKYTKIYSNIPEKSKSKAAELIERLADVLIILDEAQQNILSEGAVTEMIQGSYTIKRVSPWSQVQDAKYKSMLSIIERLDKMTPDGKTESVTKAGENLVKLVAGGRPVEVR